MFSHIATIQFLREKGPSLNPLKTASIEELHKAIESRYPEIDFKTEPRDYQYRTLYGALLAKKCLLFLGPRLGKTKISLDYVSILKNNLGRDLHFLVIVPSTSIIDVWEQEALVHSDLTTIGAYGTTSQREKVLLKSHKYDLTIISYAGIQYIFSKKIRVSTHKKKMVVDKEKLETFASRFDGIIIDEIHHCKSSSSLRFKMIRHLMKNKPFRLGLTGTPFGRDPFALWPQFYLIDEGESLSRNEMFFRDAFGKIMIDENGFQTLVFDHKKSTILKTKSSRRSLSYTTTEGLGLKTFPSNTVRLKMTDAQQKEYKKALELREAKLQNIYFKLREISSGFLRWTDPVTGRSCDMPICRGPNPKLEWLESELFETEDRVVIYYEFTWSGQQISNLLSRMKISHQWIHGGSKNAVKGIRDFQKSKISALVFQSLSGSEGIDLHNATRQIFYESTNQPIVRQQIEYRGVSTKRTEALVMDDLVCSPVEEKTIQYLKEGKDILSEIIFNPDILKG